MKILFSVLLLFSLGYSKDYGSIYVDELVSVYDGDTIKVSIKSYPQILGDKISIRLNGIDAPEIRGKCSDEKLLAKMARDFVRERLFKAKTIELRNMQRGKYFRIVADVFYDNKSISDELINEGLAVGYDGGRKKYKWCR